MLTRTPETHSREHAVSSQRRSPSAERARDTRCTACSSHSHSTAADQTYSRGWFPSRSYQSRSSSSAELQRGEGSGSAGSPQQPSEKYDGYVDGSPSARQWYSHRSRDNGSLSSRDNCSPDEESSRYRSPSPKPPDTCIFLTVSMRETDGSWR